MSFQRGELRHDFEVCCPFNMNHKMPKSRLLYHLSKGCKAKEFKGHLFAQCPYNYLHYLKRDLMDQHIRECKTRQRIESEMPFQIDQNEIEAAIHRQFVLKQAPEAPKAAKQTQEEDDLPCWSAALNEVVEPIEHRRPVRNQQNFEEQEEEDCDEINLIAMLNNNEGLNLQPIQEFQEEKNLQQYPREESFVLNNSRTFIVQDLREEGFVDRSHRSQRKRQVRNTRGDEYVDFVDEKFATEYNRQEATKQPAERPEPRFEERPYARYHGRQNNENVARYDQEDRVQVKSDMRYDQRNDYSGRNYENGNSQSAWNHGGYSRGEDQKRYEGDRYQNGHRSEYHGTKGQSRMNDDHNYQSRGEVREEDTFRGRTNGYGTSRGEVREQDAFRGRANGYGSRARGQYQDQGRYKDQDYRRNDDFQTSSTNRPIQAYDKPSQAQSYNSNRGQERYQFRQNQEGKQFVESGNSRYGDDESVPRKGSQIESSKYDSSINDEKTAKRYAVTQSDMRYNAQKYLKGEAAQQEKQPTSVAEVARPLKGYRK